MSTAFLDLASFVNAHAATFDPHRDAGFVNAWRNSFPAEELMFGKEILIGGLTFILPEKRPGIPDHIEALGQHIPVRTPLSAHAIAILGFGELGDQVLGLTLIDRFGETRRTKVTLPNWLVPKTAAANPCSLRASHLHYASGYDMDLLCPALFAVDALLTAPIQPVVIKLEPNPLAHVMAVSLIGERMDVRRK